MNTHWYLVGHRAGARIFEQEGIKPELRVVRRFDNPDGLLKTNELVSDRQGRSDSAGMPGHNPVGDSNTPREHVLENFSHQLGQFLEQEAARGAFASLVLVAEPHVLGSLKKQIGKSTTPRLREALAKDLVRVSDHEMSAHLKSVMCVREAISG
ncbi:MAG: host attachment protein [Deltaproteobacteria bacterium]|nr:host attachment protein [Deltaproteobacteria bacterium]